MCHLIARKSIASVNYEVDRIEHALLVGMVGGGHVGPASDRVRGSVYATCGSY